MDRLGRPAPRPIAVRGGVDVRLEDRLDHQFRRGLRHPVPDCRDAERALAAAGLRDHHPPHRLWSIRLRPQVLAEPLKPVLEPLRLDPFERHAVRARRSAIGARQVVGRAQDVRPPDLVVEQVEPEARLSLRLFVEFSLQSPDLVGRCEAHRQSPSPRLLRKTRPEVRVLPSPGVTRLRRYYDPVRLPPGPSSQPTMSKYDLHPRRVSPVSRLPFPTCCSHYPDGPVPVHASAASRNRAAFPVLRPGRRP
jgi:hypothetical protein